MLSERLTGWARNAQVSRAWRKVNVDWDACCAPNGTYEDNVRVILDDFVAKRRIDQKAISITVLAAVGVRRCRGEQSGLKRLSGLARRPRIEAPGSSRRRRYAGPRSRATRECFVCLLIAPSSQRLQLPAKPTRFTPQPAKALRVPRGVSRRKPRANKTYLNLCAASCYGEA